jgi:CRP-like cAMP-binding protein
VAKDDAGDAPPRAVVSPKGWKKLRRETVTAPVDVAADATPQMAALTREVVTANRGQMHKKAQDELNRKWQLLIRPSNPYKVAWDLFVGVLIVFSVIDIPFRLAFGPDDSLAQTIIASTVDAFFWTDMALSFLTAYVDEDGKLITDRCQISKRYLWTWFVPDLLSVFPVNELMMLFGDKCNQAFSGDFLKLVKAVRLLRLARLGRKMSAVSAANINPNVVRLIGVLGKILFIAHLISCSWFLIRAGPENNNGRSCPRRPAELDDCDVVTLEPTPAPTPLLDSEQIDWKACGKTSLPSSQYIACMYWTIATMMAVGYGDITADGTSGRFQYHEMLFTIGTQVIGAIAFGFIIANVTSIVETFDPFETTKKRRLDEVREFAIDRGMSRALQRQVHQHLSYFYNKCSVFEERRLLEELPSMLRCRLVHAAHREYVSSLRFLERHDIVFVCDIACYLKPMLLPFKERIGYDGDVSEEMFFVVKGKVQMFRSDSAHLYPSVRPDGVREPGDSTEEERASSTKAGRRGMNQHQLSIVLVGLFSAGMDLELDSVLNCLPMVASYVAAMTCDLLWLDQADLWNVLKRNPGATVALQARAQAQREQLSRVVSLPQRQAPELFIAMKEQIIVDDDVIDLQSALEILGDVQKKNERTVFASAKGQTHRTYQEGGEESGDADENADGETAETANVIRRAPVETEKLETAADLLRRGIIDPMHLYKMRWDAFVGLLTLIAVILVPLRLGFVNYHTVDPTWLVIDFAIDGSFLIDIITNFRTAYEDSSGFLVTNWKMIAKRYLMSWFSIDFVSTIYIPPSLKALKGLKIIRILRLLKARARAREETLLRSSLSATRTRARPRSSLGC